MKRKNAVLAALLLAGTAPAMPAYAATYLITYKGVVTDGYDYAGDFGVPNTDLTGATFKTVYTLTWPSPGAIDIVSSDRHQAFGGSDTDGVSPISSASITINGVTQTISDLSFGTIDVTNEFSGPGGGDEIFNYAGKSVGATSKALTNYISGENVLNSTDFTHYLYYLANEYDSSEGTYVSSGGSGLAANVTMFNQSVSVTAGVTAGIPEAATWAMMIAGVGLAGAALRRQGRTAQVRLTYA